MRQATIPNKAQLTLRLPRELLDELRARAQADDRSLNWLANAALAAYLASQGGATRPRRERR